MAQHDMNIANQGFPATRADLNNALQAIATNNSGTSAPSTTFANQWWYDTTNNKLYIRNEANNAWIQVAVLDQTNNEWQITTGVIQAKDGDGLALKTDDGTTRITVNDTGTTDIEVPDNVADVFRVKQASNEYISVDTTNNAEKVVIANSGTNTSIGVGVDPKVSGSAWQNFQFGGTGNLIARHSDSTVDAMIANNYYVNSSSSDAYITTGVASRMFMDDDKFHFDTAGSGSADAAASFSRRVTIDSDGVKFNGDTAAANALNDYEEGSWTPVLTGMSVSSGTLDGSYRKIGGLVSLSMRMENVTLTGTHSNGRVEGLPFSCSLRTSSGIPSLYNHQSGNLPVTILIEGGTSFAYFQYNTTGSWVIAPWSAGSNRYLSVQLTYNSNV